jgi:thiamine-monophosphate kinase
VFCQNIILYQVVVIKKHLQKKIYLKFQISLKQEQNKYGIFLCGGDTTFSNKLSFSITSVGYSKNIVYRNKAKLMMIFM